MVGVISRSKRMKAGGGGSGSGGVSNPPPPTIFKRKKSKYGVIPNKKKKTSPNPSSTSSRNNYDEDWLVFEILTRLPVKSVFRFKSVCKNWCSLIHKDQHLIDLHLTHSRRRLPPRIFIVVPLPRTKKQQEETQTQRQTRGSTFFDPWPYKEYHITADLLFEEEEEIYNNKGGSRLTGCGTKLKLVVDTVRKLDSSSYGIISKPLNGLICLIKPHREPAACIRNICTGEVSPWFQSSLRVEKEYVCKVTRYGFGFDPTTNEHKLVCVWDMNSPTRSIYDICEVLTIGRQGNNMNNNSRWRRVEDDPPDTLWTDSVYVNGVIYWTTFSLFCWEFMPKRRPVCLVAFDVGSEKFRTITILEFILDQPHDCYQYERLVKLFEVDGNLGMVVRLNNSTFKMYIYEDDDYKDKEEIKRTPVISSPRKKNGRWSEVCTITLPFQMGNDHRIKFHTFEGSDDKIFIISSIVGTKKKKCVSIYCYNWKNGSWTEVDVNEIPSSVPRLCHHSFSTTFCESLLSFNNNNAP